MRTSKMLSLLLAVSLPLGALYDGPEAALGAPARKRASVAAPKVRLAPRVPVLSTVESLQPRPAQPDPHASVPADSLRDGVGSAEQRAGAAAGLAELLSRVERFHPKLVAARLDCEIARAGVREKQGAFDPQLDLYSDTLRYNGGSGKPKGAADNTVSIGWLTPEGLKLGAGIDYDRGSVKSPTNPTGEGGEVFVDVKVPLMRGLGINPKRAAEQQALVKAGSAEVYLGLVRLQVLLAASTAWWDWVAAERRVGVHREVLEVALSRAAWIKKRVAAGDLPRLDEVEAQQEVERRRESLVKAERDAQKAGFKVTQYSWLAGSKPGPPPQKPASMALPALEVVSDEALGQATVHALANRPELRSLALERSFVNIDLDLARNDRKPRVDLFAQPGYDAGRGGVGLTIKAGVAVTIPLRTREADGRIEAASLRLQRLDAQQLHDLRAIMIEVQDAVGACNNATERHAIASRALELARQLEKGERLRYELGDGTLFLVNQRERATAEARLKVIDIEAEHAAALAAYRAVTAWL